MRRIRVIPILLLKNGGLVKTIKFKNSKYIGDPINAVKIYNDKEVDEIVILDIDATKLNQEPKYEKIREICSEAFMPFAYGGGIKNLDQIKRLFQTGIEKIIINTEAFYQPQLIEKAATIYGNQSIVVSIDVKKNIFGKYRAWIASGTINTKYKPEDFARKMADYGSGEIILTSIDREGTYKGYNENLIETISQTVKIPVVANGGAASIKDFVSAIKSGASAVSAGSIFVYHGHTKGILVNYPSQQILMDEFWSKL